MIKTYTDKIITRKTVFRKNIFQQGSGLMFRSKYALRDTAWVFVFTKEKYAPITMAFVSFPIDIVFLDKKMRIVEFVTTLRPWGFYNPKHKSQYVIEFEKGTIKKYKLKIGSKLKIDI